MLFSIANSDFTENSVCLMSLQWRSEHLLVVFQEKLLVNLGPGKEQGLSPDPGLKTAFTEWISLSDLDSRQFYFEIAGKKEGLRVKLKRRGEAHVGERCFIISQGKLSLNNSMTNLDHTRNKEKLLGTKRDRGHFIFQVRYFLLCSGVSFLKKGMVEKSQTFIANMRTFLLFFLKPK